jgi:hypothetical protein
MALSPNYNWSEPDNSSLVKDGALAMRTLGDAIDTSVWNVGYGQAGKNKLINSSFQIAQRGTSVVFGSTGYEYTLDRWKVVRGAFATGMTVSQQSAGLTGIQYCARVQRNSGNTSTQYLSFFQTVETANAIGFAGQTISISFYARKGANFSSTSNVLNVIVTSGTGTNQSLESFTGSANVLNSTATLTADWVRYSYTATVASNATEIAFETQYTPTGTAGAADYYEITGVQLEVGAKATPFQTASGGSIQGELAMCQRYYYSHAVGDQIAVSLGTYTLSSELHAHVQFPVAMRTPPTLDQATGTNYYRCFRNGAADDFDSLIISRTNTTNTFLYQTGATISGTAGDAGIIHTQNASAKLAFTSEL